MRSYLPDLNLRSYTPITSKGKLPVKLPSEKSVSVRNASLSPVRLSSLRRDSDLLVLNPRAISDELPYSIIQNDPLFQRLRKITSDHTGHTSHTSHTTTSKQRLLAPLAKCKKYSETIDALFTMYNCDRGRISAFTLSQLFVSLGFSEDCEVIIDIFRHISEGQHFNMISYTKSDLMKICEDLKTENVLKSLMKDSKAKYFTDRPSDVQMLINVLRKWWARLDRSQNGFVSIEDICSWGADIGLVENASDSKRILLKIGQYANFKQFSSLFAKAFFRFLIEQTAEVVAKGNANCLSAEIAITTQRRKMILNGVEGRNKVVGAILECKIYNN